ncbi:hypothetical protein [Streptosporangium sp. NPDC001681]|uniref:hypothetical protein n=1 Tax=Streptosporangium sp. NPDC001681 TaxID=3154395 RepID=UPI0033171B52
MNRVASPVAGRLWAWVGCALVVPAWWCAVQVAALGFGLVGREGRLVVPAVVVVVCAALWWLERVGGGAAGIAMTGGMVWLLASLWWGPLGAVVLVALSVGLVAVLGWFAALTK